MTEVTWSRVGRALLGRWPSQVAQWGEEGIGAFVEELAAVGLSPEQALVAIRSYRSADGRDFPPSAAAVCELARRDPSQPTFAEAVRLIRRALRAGRRPLAGDYANEAAMIRARHELVLDAAAGLHPMVARFVAARELDIEGLERDVLALSDDEHGGAVAHRLAQDWQRHCEAWDGREVAAIASGRGREGLRALDPLAALGGHRIIRQIGSGGGM